MLLTRDYHWSASHFAWNTKAFEDSQGMLGSLYGVNEENMSDAGILNWQRVGALALDMKRKFVFEESG